MTQRPRHKTSRLPATQKSSQMLQVLPFGRRRVALYFTCQAADGEPLRDHEGLPRVFASAEEAANTAGGLEVWGWSCDPRGPRCDDCDCGARL